MSMILPTKTPEETRDAIVAWLRSEAEFHHDTVRFCAGKRAKAARIAEADLIANLADSLTKYRTPAEMEAQ
jgi:hypothetical protein